MRALFKVGVFVLVGLSMAACSSGVREFQAYSTAFDQQDATAQQVLDEVALAERAHWAQLHGQGTSLQAFVPDEAAYYVDGGDPPLTASMRRSLKAIKTYNASLLGLANGETADALTAKLSTMALDIVTAQSALSSASKKSGAIQAVAQSFSKELSVASVFVDFALKAAARESFRSNLLDGYPAMRGILVAFRAGTDKLYYALISVPGTSPEARRKSRTKLASWVLLIDRTIETMDAAVAAVKDPHAAVSIDVLAEQTVELRVLAERLKAERNR